MPVHACVDVVIPVFQRDILLCEAVQSVLDQTFSDLNIFIVEDGSNTLKNSLSFFRKHSNIFFTRLEKNRGVSWCRNFGAAHGKSEYIAFLDSDDLWAPCKIEKQVKFLENNPEFQWVHTNEIWLKNQSLISQKKEHRKQGGIFFDKAMDRCLISPSSVFFRRKFFEESSGFNPYFRVAEDFELWLRLNLHNPVGYLEDELTIKRAGEWKQLSRTLEIDRWRVLALHRIYRMFRYDPEFTPYRNIWKSLILKKIHILKKGAEKYNRREKLKVYQNWSKVFNAF